MHPSPSTPEPAPRLADRMAAAWRGRFVGRMTELETFRRALLADEPPFAVLHVFGPGGVGKSTLLREFARLAVDLGRPVVHLDGRNVDPSPPGLLLALRQATRAPEERPPVTSGRAASSPSRSRSTAASQAASSWWAGAGERRPATT